MENFEDNGAHAAHSDVAGNLFQFPPGTEHGVDEGVIQSPLSEAAVWNELTPGHIGDLVEEAVAHLDEGVEQNLLGQVAALLNEGIAGHIHDPVENAVGNVVDRSEKFFQVVMVVEKLLHQHQLCDCRDRWLRNFSGFSAESHVQVTLDGMSGRNEQFFCSVCENQYFQLLLGKDVREDCETLLGFLENDTNDYEFRCAILDMITFLIRFLPNTIPTFMNGHSFVNGYVLDEGRAMRALNMSLLGLFISKSATRYGREHRLHTIRENIRVAALFRETMTDLNIINPEDYVPRAEVILNLTHLQLENNRCGSFAAYVLVGLIQHAATAAYDCIGNAVFGRLSQEIVIKWWDYAFDQSADPQFNGHLRLLRLVYSWYISGRFMFQQGTLAWKILWVPMLMQIGKSRDMEKLGPFLKMAAVSWRSNDLSEFVAIDADIREDLRSFWPLIACERNLILSDNQYLRWTLKVFQRLLISGKEFTTVFGARYDIHSHIDYLDKVEVSTQTCVTVCSRGEVVLSGKPLYYLVSPVLLESHGTVKKIEISSKRLEHVYTADGKKRHRMVGESTRSSPALKLNVDIIRKDGSSEALDELMWHPGQDAETIDDYMKVIRLKASDRLGVWASTTGSGVESSQGGANRTPKHGAIITSSQRDSELHLQSMSINIHY